jgi:hypothetical protein
MPSEGWQLVHEDAESRTDRLRVITGWLYRTILPGGAVALAFVPGDRKLW